MFPRADPTSAPKASPASQLSASVRLDQANQYVLTDGSPPIRFRPSYLASSVAAGSPAYDEHDSQDDGDWANDDLTLTEQSFSKLNHEIKAPLPKPTMGKRIVVAAHLHGAPTRSVFQEPLPSLLEGCKARWLQKEPVTKDKHPVGVGLNWSQVLEERAKPKASYFDSDRNVVPAAKTLSPSMVRSYAQQELSEMIKSRAALKDELLGVLHTMHSHADTGQLLLANSALEQFKNLQSSLEACRVEECREQLRRDIDELHQRHVLEQEALEADWDAKFDAFAQKCSEITRQIEEQWIETEKSLDFNVQAELRPYVPSPALFNMRRGLRTLVKMREYLEAHNYSPLVQKKEVAERTEWEVELQRKIALTLHRKKERKNRKLAKLHQTWDDTRQRMNLTYQRALQVLNDRFYNVEHALQVRCDQQIRAAVAAVRRTICDVQAKEEVVVKKVKKDEALANYKLQISNLLQTESRIRRLFRDIEQVNRVWSGLDNNGNGLVSLAELDAWLPKSFPELSYKMASKAAFNMTIRADPHYDSKTPFVQKHLVCPVLINLLYTHRALLAFHLCDSKNKNSVDLKGLLKKASHIGLGANSDQLAAEFSVVDSDGSGRLHFSEFCPWFVQSNIEHGIFESYKGEDVVTFKRFVARQDKSEEFELSKFLDAQEIAWKQCALDPSKMTKEWNRLDANGNGLVSGAEVDTWVQQHHKPLRQRAVIKQAVLQTLKLENGQIAEYIKRDTFPALLVNFVACMRAWIMFDSMNQTEEHVGLKDKRIEFNEFRDGLMKLSHTITADIVQSEWNAVDSDGKGMVLFNEFSNWYQAKHIEGWFEQRRHERMAQETKESVANQMQAQAARASRMAKEAEEAAKLKRSILLTPFNWNDGASRAQAKLNAALETQFLDVFQSSKDGVPNVGLNKLWLQLDNNGNGLVSKQELTSWTEKKYPMLSIAAVSDAYAATLTLDGFGAKFVKRSMFKNLFLRLIVPYLLHQRLTVAIGENYSGALSPEQQQHLLQRLNTALSEAEIATAIVEMDSNGNGVITGQELSSWFIKLELNVALLDTVSFRDPAPAQNEALKKKDAAAASASKQKKRAKLKKKSTIPEPPADDAGDGFSSSVACDADGSGEEPEAKGDNYDGANAAATGD